MLKMNFELFSELCSGKLYDLLFPDNAFELSAVLRQMRLDVFCFILWGLNAKVFYISHGQAYSDGEFSLGLLGPVNKRAALGE